VGAAAARRAATSWVSKLISTSPAVDSTGQRVEFDLGTRQLRQGHRPGP
jgi:hypothetical protein